MALREDEIQATRGSVDTIGWFALFHFEQPKRVNLGNDTVPGPFVTIPAGSYILGTDDQGFVWVELDHPLRSAELMEEWRKIVAADSDWHDDAFRDDLAAYDDPAWD